MRNIVEFKVEEHLESALLEFPHDRRAFGIVERHAHLEPLGMPGEGIRQRKRLLAVAIEGYNHALARLCI